MDAIGKTITTMCNSVPKENRVLFVIMTDGLENASREYNKDKVRKLIKKHNAYEFVFLGANIVSEVEGMSIGISKERTANFSQNKKSIGSVFECASMLCEDMDVNLRDKIIN